MINVLVVDDSSLMRRMISEMLDSASDIRVVGTAKDGLEAVEKTEKLRPDVVTNAEDGWINCFVLHNGENSGTRCDAHSNG
jgi:AmiR/NasT family two-component response regulator